MRNLGAWSLFLGLVGCAAPPAEGKDESTRISKETIVAGTDHSGDPAVVFLAYPTGSLCTGTLIAPQVVLTARHCVEDPETGAATEPSHVGTGASSATGTAYANVIAVRKTTGPIVENDLALLILDRAGSLTPYEWVADAPPEVGDRVIGVGYGETDTMRLDHGTKRRGESTIGSMTEREFVTGGALSCHGDSGGPGFLDDGRVFGVVSRGTGDTCAAGETIYMRTDAFRELIEAAIAESEGPRESPPGGADPEPPPGDGGGEPPPTEDPGTWACTDTCPWAFDGMCDDGGSGSLYDVCATGTDCGDCGPRDRSDGDSGGGSGGFGCDDSCPWAYDGVCDDGGPGASFAVCPLGTDCGDCGPR